MSRYSPSVQDHATIIAEEDVERRSAQWAATDAPRRSRLRELYAAFVSSPPGSLKRMIRSLPVRRVRIDKGHAELPRLVTRLCWRRGLDAEDARLFDTLSEEMRRDHSTQVQEHFTRASSNDQSLRLLKDLAEMQESTSILEVGSGYGLSAIALARTEASPRVVTVENSADRFAIARANARKAKAANVQCIRSDKIDALQTFLDRRERFDFIFHDGGHYGDDYVRDFHIMRRMLEPGALMVFDDIAWDRTQKVRAFTRTRSARSCLQGWKEVVASPFVSWAVAISGKMGVLRLA